MPEQIKFSHLQKRLDTGTLAPPSPDRPSPSASSSRFKSGSVHTQNAPWRTPKPRRMRIENKTRAPISRATKRGGGRAAIGPTAAVFMNIQERTAGLWDKLLVALFHGMLNRQGRHKTNNGGGTREKNECSKNPQNRS